MKKYFLVIVVLFSFNSTFAQWTKLTGPEGCTASGFVKTSHGIFLGTFGGLYISTDDASSWQVAPILQDAHVSSIVAVSDTVVLTYETTGDGVVFYDSYTMTSFDGGLTWTNADTLFNVSTVQLHIHGSSLFASSDDKLFYSSDFGLNWSIVNMPIGNYSSSAFYKDYFLVNTLGNSFYTFISPLDSTHFTPYSYQNVTVMIDSIIFTIQTSSVPGSFDIIRSNDLGNTWVPVITIDSVLNFKLLVYNDSLFYNDRLDNFYVSANLGVTWNPTHKPYQYNTFKQTLRLQSGEILCCHYLGELYHYIEGNDSSYLSRSGIHEANSLLYNTGNIIYCPANTGFYRSLNDGQTWQLMNDNYSTYLQYGLLVSGDSLFGVSSSFQSCYNGGQTWNYPASSGASFPLDYLCRKNNRFFVSGWNNYFYSDDFGDSWSPINGLPQNATTCGINSESIGSLSSLGNHVYSCTSIGFVYELDSTDQHWLFKHCVSGGINSVFSFNIYTAGSSLIVSSYDALRVSPDSGQTWITSSMSGLPNDHLGRTICPKSIVQSGNDLIGYCNGLGIYASSNNGISWYRVIPGPMPFYPNSIIIHNNQLYVSGMAQGIWTPNLILDSPVNNEQTINKIKIFPNPVYDHFQIEIDEMPNDNVNVSLYNSIGVCVKEIKINSISTTISTIDLQKGVYIGKVTSKNISTEGFFRIVVM